MVAVVCKVLLLNVAVVGILQKNAFFAKGSSLDDDGGCSIGCIPVPEGTGWDWISFRQKIQEENDANTTHVRFCGPFVVKGKASLATRDIPNIRQIECCGGPCRIEPRMGQYRRAFRFNSDDFKLKGFYLRSVSNLSGHSEGFLVNIRNAKRITLEDCVIESDWAIDTYAVIVSGQSEDILFDRCTIAYNELGSMLIEGKSVRNVTLRHSLVLNNFDAGIRPDDASVFTVEGSVLAHNYYWGTNYDTTTDADGDCFIDDERNGDLGWRGDIDNKPTVINSYVDARISRTPECQQVREQEIDNMIDYLTGLGDCPDGNLLRHFDHLIGPCGSVRGLKAIILDDREK